MTKEILFEKYLPFYTDLNKSQKEKLIQNANIQKFSKDNMFLTSKNNCTGLVIVKSGLLRIYFSSENGKEISLYKLLEGDCCILSASCIIKDINFDVNIKAEQDSEVVIVPSHIFEEITQECNSANSFKLSLISSRFSDVMWVLEQFVFSSGAKRLANELIDHINITGSNVLTTTHEKLARDLGSAREVITRLLKQFAQDNIVKLSRSKIEILDLNKLHDLIV